ncbi:MAG: helix-turn-helix transcriptional regulator, partial [Bacillota bacterium]
MFDMQHVSKTITALRKARNMIQMELADRLNISFQAVSNWERGQTMPDIAKLGELADIFGVTIDELLGNKKSAQVVEKLIREEPIREEISAEEFLNIAPLVKPSQAEKLWENVSADISMKDLAMAAPFISESVLDDLAVRAAQREKSFESLAGLLPFI